MDSKHSRRAFMATGIGAAAWASRAAVGAPQDLTALTLRQASQMLRSKAVSPVELAQACLQRIDRYNPAVNAFITVTGESALATAREREAEAQRGKWRGPLHGIPIALKDNIDTAGIRTTGASELFKDRVPAEDSEVARRLKDAGAILLGKLNMHEFAYGATSAVSYFGPVHNPWALDHVSGGSSGGSAAAIATNLCFGTLGTDTGGSIRIPSSHCGVVGLMPTYGRVSNRGVIPMAWTLDHVGPICKTVEDASVRLECTRRSRTQTPSGGKHQPLRPRRSRRRPGGDLSPESFETPSWRMKGEPPPALLLQYHAVADVQATRTLQPASSRGSLQPAEPCQLGRTSPVDEQSELVHNHQRHQWDIRFAEQYGLVGRGLSRGSARA